MNFLNPGVLAAGLACISLPIIIHLLMHRRRKPVVWGAMRFLLEAYRRQQRRLMLEKWLLLACRCLLVAAVALALGKPLFGGVGVAARPQTLFIVLDNALASSARDASGSLAIDRLKARAKALLDGLKSRPGDGHRAALITLGSPAEGAVMPPSTDLGAVGSLVDQIEPVDSKGDLAGALAQINAALAPSGGGASRESSQPPIVPEDTIVAILSEFREGSLALSGTDAVQPSHLPAGVRILAPEPATDTPANVAITAADPLRSVLLSGSADPSAEFVRVTLHRTEGGSREAQTSQVWARFVPSDAAAPQARPTQTTVVRWQPGQESAVVVVPLKADNTGGTGTGPGAESTSRKSPARGSGVVIVGVEEGDAIATDNRFRRALDVRDALRVGVIAPSRFGRTERADKLDSADWVRLALAPAGEGAGVEVVNIEPAAIDAARLAGLDAVVLPRPDLIPETSWPRIKLFLDSGGLVMITPPPTATVQLWGEPMSKALGADWSVARESTPVEGVKLARVRSDDSTSTGLLALIDGELDELVSPVSLKRTLPLQPVPEHGQVLLTLGEKGPAVLWAGPAVQGASRQTDSRGLVIYLGVALDLEWSDLPAKPLMVPLVQELIRQGVGRARGSFVSIAGDRPVAPSRSVVLEAINDPATPNSGPGTPKLPPPIRVDAQGLCEPVRHAGVFRAVDDAGNVRAMVTVNADPRGSKTGAQPKASVEAWLREVLTPVGGTRPADSIEKNITWLTGDGASETNTSDASLAISRSSDSSRRGWPAWWGLLLAALGLGLAELYLARRASHASVIGSGATSTGDSLASAPAPREAAA